MTQYQETIVGKPGGLVEPGVKQYGFLKKAFKKIKKGAKKIWKSPLGKAAIIGGLGAYGLGSLGGGTGWGRFSPSAMKAGLSRMGGWGTRAVLGRATGQGAAGQTMPRSGGLWNLIKKYPGRSALLGLGAAGTIAPFLGGDEDEEVIDDWSVTPSSIAKIRQMARDQDPSLAFLPPAGSVMSGYYGSKEGGIVGLANGGAAGNAQAEQMLKMEYQKYRNQGGTMSYQQFKMAVLQQAQGQGPRAQGQVEDRPMFQGGELVEDASMVEETPTGMMEENVEEVQGEPTREQLEVLAMEIFQLRLEELDEEQLMVVYQAAMEQQPEAVAVQEDIQFDPQMAAEGGRMGYLFGKKVGVAYANPNVARSGNLKDNMLNVFANKFSGKKIASPGSPVAKSSSFMGNMLPQLFKSQDADYQAYIASGSPLDYQAWKASSRQAVANGGLIGSHVPGYTTPPGYNQFDYPSGGVRVGRAEGGLMSLGGMEKDYRQEGGFVPLGGEEKADDVPARLSKNEFVFTADAVRAAGGGDIDQGAEVMENVMENLESGGEISEESQGAQGMYNNMQQLQTRIE
jgi:hypothetical protein